MKFVPFVTAIALFGLASMGSTDSNAATVALHSGAADPTTEGWSASGSFSNVVTGPVTNDLGLGLDAWKVDDNGTALGNLGTYNVTLTPGELSDALTYGWHLSARLRIVDVPDPGAGQPSIGFDASPFVAFRTETTNYSIFFGTQADGDPTIFVPTASPPSPAGASYALEGGGAGYHLYELVSDPIDGLRMYIDNILVLSALSGTASANVAVVTFGAGSSCCLGDANFNSVQLDVMSAVPVPTALPLFLSGLGLVGYIGARRRRSVA